MEAIWQYVLAKQNDFRDTQVKPRLAAGPVRDPRYRRSRVLFDIGPHREFMALRLRSYLPWVIGRLIYSPFKFGHLAIHLPRAMTAISIALIVTTARNHSGHVKSPLSYILCGRRNHLLEGSSFCTTRMSKGANHLRPVRA
jgi:hypothetical protein